MAETTKSSSDAWLFLLAVIVGIGYFEVRTYMQIEERNSPETAEEVAGRKSKPQQTIVVQKQGAVKVQLTDSIQLHLVAPEPKVVKTSVQPSQPTSQNVAWVQPKPKPAARRRDDRLPYETNDEYLRRKYEEALDRKNGTQQVW